MQSEASKSTVFYDGSCPLCRAEIGHYRRADNSGALCFVDVSDPNAPPPIGLTRQQAMDRFHVRSNNGELLSGAAAFADVWSRLPGWRWAARAAALPGAMTMLEFGYRLILPVRPFISRFIAKLQRSRRGSGKEPRL